jgi:hypothetical protein
MIKEADKNGDGEVFKLVLILDWLQWVYRNDEKRCNMIF